MLPILFHKLLQKADKFSIGNFGLSTAGAVFNFVCNKRNDRHISLQESESVRHSLLSDSAIPWTVVRQAPLSMGCSRQEHWSGLPFPPPGDPPNPGIKPTTLKSPALAGGYFTTGVTWETHIHNLKEALFSDSIKMYRQNVHYRHTHIHLLKNIY